MSSSELRLVASAALPTVLRLPNCLLDRAHVFIMWRTFLKPLILSRPQEQTHCIALP